MTAGRRIGRRVTMYCWLVDHSSRVIAVYNGEPSGTRNTILYARKTRVPVRVLKG